MLLEEVVKMIFKNCCSIIHLTVLAATEDNTLIVHNVPKATTEEELKEIYPNAHVKARTRMAARDKDPDQAG